MLFFKVFCYRLTENQTRSSPASQENALTTKHHEMIVIRLNHGDLKMYFDS